MKDYSQVSGKELQQRRFALQSKVMTRDEEQEYKAIMSELERRNPEMTASPFINYNF